MEYVNQNIQNRKSHGNVEAVVEAYDRYVSIQWRVDELRARRNALAKQGNAMSKEERQMEGKRIKDELVELEKELQQSRYVLDKEAGGIPCDTHPDSPIGPESNARTILTVGSKAEAPFPLRDHVEIGKRLGLFDLEAGSSIAGSGFVVLKGDGVLLELALTQWALSRVAALGFTPLAPPDMAQSLLIEGCGFNPRPVVSADGTEVTPSQIYGIEGTSLSLIGTSEIPLAGMHANQILNAPDLPILYAGMSHCFRHEAGSGGLQNRGLYRLHQFSKVEMFAFVDSSKNASVPSIAAPEQFAFPELYSALIHPSVKDIPSDSGANNKLEADLGPNEPVATSEHLFARLVDIQASLYRDLGLHFRVLDMPSEELGASAYRKVDIEAWMPGRLSANATEDTAPGVYGEVSSASNCIDYQSRRLNIRSRSHSSSINEQTTGPKYVHTLNATAIAIPRIMIALLETHQTPEGNVKIPECLQPFLGGRKVLTPKK